jgi:hypothetical protein
MLCPLLSLSPDPFDMGNPNWRLQNRVTSPMVEQFWRENFGEKKALVHTEQFLAAMESIIDTGIQKLRPLFTKQEMTKARVLLSGYSANGRSGARVSAGWRRAHAG